MNLPTIPVHRGLDTVPQAGLEVDDPILDDAIVDVDWRGMDAAAQRDYYAENGFLVVPGALPDQDLVSIHSHLDSAGWPNKNENIWNCPEVVDLIVRREVRALPVVGENFEVLGIITSGDALDQVLRDRPAEEAGEAPSEALAARELATLVAKVEPKLPPSFFIDCHMLENRFEFQRYLTRKT